MLALAGFNLIALLLSVFYLFGAAPFGTADAAWARFLLYLLTQLLWLLPVALFFASLDTFRRGYERAGAVLAALGCLVTLGGIALLVW